MVEQLLNNDLLTGGAILGSLGLLIRWVQPQLARLWWWIRNSLIVTVIVTDEFKQFKWVSYWIADHPYTRYSKRVSFDSFVKKSVANNELLMSLAPGRHLLWHNKRPILVKRVMDKLQMKDEGVSSIRYEWVLLIFGSREYVDQLFKDMEACYRKHVEGGVATYQADMYGYFKESQQVKPRSLDSVLLPENIKTEIQEDLQEFLNNDAWYADKHIPWRRGYLLEGIPGSGKTSLIRALASHFNLNLYMIPLQEVTDGQLVSLLNQAQKGIVLLEDIDRVGQGAKLTFSGLLNALDGALSIDGRIVCMTSNYAETLDEALIRPGRIDRRFRFDYAKKPEIAKLYERFYPHSDGSDFAAKIEPLNVSMAAVQGHLLKYRTDPGKAVRNYGELQTHALRSQDGVNDVQSGHNFHGSA